MEFSQTPSTAQNLLHKTVSGVNHDPVIQALFFDN